MNLNPVGWASSSLRIVARLFNGGVNSTTPVTAISEAPVGATNADIALVAKGTGATLAQVPDGTVVGGNKRGLYATDWQKSRTLATQVASGFNCVITGGANNIASLDYSCVGGGNGNTASSFYSTVAGGDGNSATGSRSTVAGGQTNNASGSRAVIVGGEGNNASSNYSFVGGGQNNAAQTGTHATMGGGSVNTASGGYSIVAGGSGNYATGSNATVAGGSGNYATGTYSFISGGAYGITRSIVGNHVFPACNAPISTSTGVTQSALLLLGRQTTDATTTVLTSNSSAAGTTNQVILPNNSAYSFSGEVIAGVTGAGNTARWTIDGAIKRGANAASTTMVGTATVTMTHNDAGAAAWLVAVTADTTNGGIKVEVTGAAATTIRWVCRISTVEMTY